MKIKEFIIHNWRSVEDEKIICENLMVVIGQNNHGKSNLLYALLFFFGEIDVTDMDFRKGTSELFVEVEFKDLDAQDLSQFQSYLTETNTIRIRKTVTKEDGSKYNGYRNTPTEAFLNAEAMTRAEFNACPLASYDSGSGRLAKATLQAAQQRYIQEHNETLVLNYSLESTPFMGAKNVAQGIFGRVFFVPAVRNAADELGVKGKSVFGQLFTNVINLMSERNQQYRDIKQGMAMMIQGLNRLGADGVENTNRPDEITKLETKIGDELAAWGVKIEVEVTPPDIDNMLKIGTNVWVDDGVRTDVGRKGNGLQRSLIFALIKSWADILRERASELVSEGSTPPVRKTSDSTFFIFEEPELYLHPQAQKELFSSLRLLSGESQVFLTSHSSSFINISDYKSICIAYKETTDSTTKICQCTEDLFANASDKEKFNLAYWINPDRGELFFARKIILVEGQSDKTVLPYIAKEIIHNFRFAYTLIDCGGKGNMPLYIELLNKFKRKYVVVYDKDHQSWKTSDGKNSADIDSGKIQNVINSAYGKAIILVNDIEEEIGLVGENHRNKPTLALQRVSSASFVLTPQLRQKIETIYEV